MPNWNMNNMYIKGEPKLVLQFINENYLTEKAQKEPEEFIYILDFEKFLPTPLKEDGGIIDEWYDWRCKNWGTKWSASLWQTNCLDIIGEGMEDIELDNQIDYKFNEENINELYKKFVEEPNDETSFYTEATLQCSFDTAWCPPEGMFYLWKEKYQPLGLELSIKFYEPGCCFAGEFTFSKEGCNEVCYADDEISYIGYLLEEGWESIEYYIDEIEFMIDIMNKDKGFEFIDKLQELVKQKLMEAPTNIERAKLVVDIFDKYRDYELNIKEE